MKKSELLYNYPFAVVGNIEGTKFFLLIELPEKTHGAKRIKISLPQGLVEKYNFKLNRWDK